ncbi:four-carbon acid sugar kinase family protein [Antarctobacter heliothermus]|uniref:Uncharacterized conserved protein YgbK, DUF1537 family n=1 Tax=Antarctobacter heliothermus TaxID=74033 RepID=A0A239KPK0_9RHOB|nr:four-carbon acid sugar kinase family protein [Antarctobacter heliothermus]SNT20286.1 Uncharacterized conserved protein YgbK, DUF1537 family [Antarctobacter heliothermus]
MPHLALIADDLSGALDSAAPFSGAGKVVVASHPSALGRALRVHPDVVAVSTRSREVSPDEALARVRSVLLQMPTGTRLFKKIDSRLKGNIAAELTAFEVAPLLVAPAIPEFGRVVVDGRLTGFGVAHPIRVASVLGDHATRARIPDVQSDQDILAAIAALAPDEVLVGARGLAHALRASMPGAAPDIASLPGPLCFAVGSADPITLAQMDALRRHHPGLQVIEAPSGTVPDGIRTDAPVTLVQIVPGAGTARDEVARRFAKGVARIVSDRGTLLVSGGATAEAVLDALGIDVLTIEGEVLPGLPCCRVGHRRIISKSGGFGAEDTFVRLLNMTRLQESTDHD